MTAEDLTTLRSRILDVISRITSYAFPSIRSTEKSEQPGDVYEYIAANQFQDFWHKCLGNMVSNWYFFVRDKKPELIRIHKYEGCRLNPSWACNFQRRPPDSGFRFDCDPFPEDEKNRIQAQVDFALHAGSQQRSVNVAMDLLRSGRLWRSRSENNIGWIFVELGEMLLYSFEHLFLQKCSEDLGPYTALGHIAPDTADRHATEAWQSVIGSHSGCDNSDESRRTVNSWTERLWNGRDGDYKEWFSKSPPDWFTQPQCGGPKDGIGSLEAPVQQLTPTHWARCILASSGCETLQECNRSLLSRVRFAPGAERELHSRNLVIFPLWTQQNQLVSPHEIQSKPKPPLLSAPFGALFIATFYDDEIVSKLGATLTSLLYVMAQQEIIYFARQQLVGRERERLVSMLISHALKNRARKLSHAQEELTRFAADPQFASLRPVLSKLTRQIDYFLQTGKFGAMLSSRRELHSKTLINLSELVAEVTQHLDDPRIVVHEIPIDLHVLGDRPALYDVLLELLANALDFVELRPGTTTPCVEVKCIRAPPSVEIHVVDNGPGVHPNVRQSLFTPFSCYPASRIGLGLAYCYEVAKEHGGELRECGVFGIGAHFVLTLPRYREPV
jgi:signal transduction histidine kinase